MLATLGLGSLDALIDAAVPAKIRLAEPMKLPAGHGEHESLAELRGRGVKLAPTRGARHDPPHRF